jgi:hypothetical protein
MKRIKLLILHIIQRYNSTYLANSYLLFLALIGSVCRLFHTLLFVSTFDSIAPNVIMKSRQYNAGL